MSNPRNNPPNGGSAQLPLAPQVRNSAQANSPLIPLNILDAPSQRLYAFAIYAGLLAWKFYDWLQLVEDDTESIWLFMKWLAIDLVFLFGLPELRIPWLELSQPFVVALFFCHGIFNYLLMFNVGLPWQSWILGFMKVFYDSEMAISERNVKISNILHNNSLIMGKYTVNILPEGSAVLNPDGNPFCLGSQQKEVKIPIFFNSTLPYEVEIVRVDLISNVEESIWLSRRQLREIERQVKKPGHSEDPANVRFDYTTEKPGAYRLGKVLDKYKLEVQRDTPFTFVVPCPRAHVPRPSPVRCLGDLSDMAWQVEGTPPLKITYRRSINGQDASFHFQSLQPDAFASPLVTSSLSNSMIASEDDVTWARSRIVVVPLNESMNTGGDWRYSVDEVVDGFGNVVKYFSREEDIEPSPRARHSTQTPVQSFLVKERPRVRLEGCDLRKPLKVAKGGEKELPVAFQTSGRTDKDGEHSLTWQFSPIDSLTQSGDHGEVVSMETYKAKKASDKPRISKPGLYTLKSVSSASCEGEVQEPSSCLLLNPIEPELKIRSEKIPDLCAGNSIGLRVDLNLVGTPPFRIRYTAVSNGQVEHKTVNVAGMRDQLELIPRNAGHHTYKFNYIDDGVYSNRELRGPEYELEQDVKPAAYARIVRAEGRKTVCLEEDVEVVVVLQGEAPFTLEWELMHENKGRVAHKKVSGIETTDFTIKTGSLARGGEYTLALTKIQDARGCPNALQEEQKIVVRRQRPRASFGMIENKRKATVVESAKVNIPVRLAGEGPWDLTVRNLDKTDSQPFQKRLQNENDKLEVRDRGTYEIVDIQDSQCAGTVDPSASRFQIDWVPRPELSLMPSDTITKRGDKHIKAEVCQGDLDGFEVGLTGTPPFLLEYSIRHKASNGVSSMARRTVDTMSSKAAVQMDTSKAGIYHYEFSSLGDQLYDGDKRSKELVVEQSVNAKPSASFAKPGQTYKYCKAATDGDAIPISLTGVPPFALEVEIKHHSGSAETYRVVSIESANLQLQIPADKLKLGTQQVRIREVKDANGCVARSMTDGPTVQVQQYDAPAIYPLETRSDYCVGDRLSFALTGTPPFEVYYTFDGTERKAKSPTTNFRRVAETPGEFRITGVSDKASECRAAIDLLKTIHPLPAVKISKGKNVHVDIHEGGETEILFEFWGTPPFEFTYTRSTNPRKGQRSRVLETRHDVSHEHRKVVRASQEGTYEVVAIKDQYCAFSMQRLEATDKKQKLLQ